MSRRSEVNEEKGPRGPGPRSPSSAASPPSRPWGGGGSHRADRQAGLHNPSPKGRGADPALLSLAHRERRTKRSTSGRAREPAGFKHITKRRKRN